MSTVESEVEQGDTSFIPVDSVPLGCRTITPQMLPLVELEPGHIAQIVRTVPGGAGNIQDICPLMPLQEGILFHHIMNGGADSYVGSTLFEFYSRASLDAFIDALQSVVRRHDVLRTAVLWEGLPRPVQVVYRRAVMSVEHIVLDESREPIAQLRELMSPATQSLDLSRASLMRLKISADRHEGRWYGLLQFHHLIFDGKTLEIILNEVMAHIEGRANELEQPTSYRSHVAELLAQARLRDADLFFRKKLGDIEEPTAPFGIMDVRGDGNRIAEASVGLETGLAERARSQARRARVSVATLFHAAWGLAVSRMTGHSDVVYGTVLFGRLQGTAGHRTKLGMFINTLPLRLQLAGLSAQELVKRTQLGLLELLGYEQASLAVAQRCSGVTGSRPLFTTLLNYRHLRAGPKSDWIDVPGLRVLARSGSKTSYPITVSVAESVDLFTLTAQTDPRIDPDRMLEYLLTAIGTLVSALEKHPGMAATALSTLPALERSQVIEAFNATEAAYPAKQMIHRLFEARVELAPEAPAAEFDSETVSYSDLNKAANRLGWYLRKQGLQSGEHVPILMRRGLNFLLAQLAVLKAGGTYVPVDPEQPRTRQEFVLRDCDARWVLCERAPVAGFDACSARLIDTAAEAAEISAMPSDNLPLPIDSASPAYVMYTSGSTGIPKGVLVPHRAVVRLVINNGYAQIEPSDCIAHCSNPAFDASTFEIWAALLNGARVLIVPHITVLDAGKFAALLGQRRATVLWLTAGLFCEYAEALGAVFRQLRYLLVGGDVVDPAAVRRVILHNPPQHLLNGYGPTECTTFSTTYLIETVGPRAPSIPIGKPISNTRVYILDEYLQPLPVGVEGEIYIGGDGVALGYLNQPDLTREKFIHDPFCATGRMYRTGDRGRWRLDGVIEYLGRQDRQVKIRGFRIELGEIEAHLGRHAHVRDAVVLAREDAVGEKKLVAYIVPRDSVPSVEALRAHLKSLLPAHMIPQAFVVLPKFPLTANGKLDRSAFPAPQVNDLVSRQFEAPQGYREQMLAGIWQGLLRVERVGRGDNFFELGGHSLLIVQMLERLRRAGMSVDLHRIFESPTLSDMAAALRVGTSGFEPPPNLIPPGAEIITPQMLTLVRLEQAHIDEIVRAAPGAAANIQDIYPLAPLQEGILFHHLLKGRNEDAYARAMSFSLSSGEKLQTFIVALQEMIRRHDVLRTAVMWERLPMPVQVVLRRAILSVQEWALTPNRDVTAELADRMRLGRESLDLRQAPPMRLEIAADPQSDRWYAVLHTHHLVCDNESLNLLMAEVQACMAGQGQGLPEPAPYRNHVAEALDHARTHDAEAFFRDKLASVDEPTASFGLLDLHGDGVGVDTAQIKLDPGLVRKVRLQAGRLGVSTATLFHAAWALVVSHTSRRKDVVFGSVLLGRLQGSAGAERVLGMFINTLPMRIQLDSLTAKGLIEQTQQELVGLLSHEQTSLAVAQRCSGVAGSTPLFNSIVNYRHGEGNDDSRWPQDTGVTLLAFHGGTNYPIVLSVDDLGEELRVMVQADRRIDAQRMVAYVHTAVRSLADSLECKPSARALALSILPEAERAQQIELFNATREMQAGHCLIHELFEEQVRRTPDATAAVHGAETFTYRKLNERANQLARFLRAEGVGPDQRVGVCLERGFEMVVGLLAILKAGGAYVPLDPSYPLERLQYMLNDAAPMALLTEEKLRGRLPKTAARVVVLSHDWNDFAEWPSGNLGAESLGLSAKHLAYVIYTSGSTGQPKGVMIDHSGVVNFLRSMQRRPGISPGDCLLAVTTISFDIAALEIYLPLANGATVVVATREDAQDASRLTALLEEKAITIMQATPATWRLLLDAGWRGRPSLKALCGGEALTADVAARLLTKAGSLWNLYGPTETTIWSCSQRISAASERVEPVEPIGRPIDNTQIYILDGDLQLLPTGVVGEIYIGGAGVARGYLNRPELTAARFQPNPFGEESGTLIYKTGDLGRWRSDGSIECLGRNDNQVKVRGFRIELGEIEARLARHASVQQSVVVVREDVKGEQRLVAYVIASGAEPSAADLRAHVGAVLPEYMIPSAFVMLSAFPMTPNGKLDRRALPAPELAAYVSRQYEAPRGELEELLAGIWQSVLGVERVGREDNFFELGGHSLLGVRLILRVAESLGIQPPVISIFQCPTIRQLAQLLRKLLDTDLQARNPGAPESECGVSGDTVPGALVQPPLTPRERFECVPLTFSQQRWWNGLELDRRPSIRTVAVAARLTGRLNLGSLQRSVTELVRRHESLRTRIVAVHGVPRQQIDPTPQEVLQVIELPQIAKADVEEEARRLADHVVREPLQVNVGPLFAARILKLGASHHILVLAADHTISDLVSMGILWRELFTMYAQLQGGWPPSLPDLTIQFADFAVWQQKAHRAWMQAHSAYWEQHLAGARRVRVSDSDEIPVSVPRRWETLSVNLGESLTTRLRQLSRKELTTSVMSVLAVYATLLSRWFNVTDLVIPFVTNGRNRPEIDNAVGFFSVTLFLRIALHEDDTFCSLLRRMSAEYGAACSRSDSGSIAARVPEPDFVGNPIFNWTPADSISDANRCVSGVGGDASLKLAPYALAIAPRDDTEWGYEFGLELSDAGGNVSGLIRYRADRVTSTTVRRFARNFEAFAAKLLEEPTTPVAALQCER